MSKESVFGVILVCNFPHLELMRRDTEHLSVFSPNAGKYGPEKLRIQAFSRSALYGFLEKTNVTSLYIVISAYIWLWLFVVLERHQWALLLLQNLFFNKRYKCSHFIYFLSTFSLERGVLQIWLSPLLDFFTTNLIACLNLTSLLFMYYEFGYVKTFFKSSFRGKTYFW